jgi:hypothetical protein
MSAVMIAHFLGDGNRLVGTGMAARVLGRWFCDAVTTSSVV